MAFSIRSLAAALAVALLPSLAVAQSADALLAEGVEHRRAHRDADALAAFTRAWDVCHCAEARVQMALAAQALGRWCDAASLLDEALAASDDPFVRQHRDALDAERRDIAHHIGTLRVDADAPDARVTLDDQPIASGTRCVAVGPHAVAATAADREPVARSLSVDADAVVDLHLALPRLRVVTVVAPPSPSAWPRVARTARWFTLAASGAALVTAATATALEAGHVARWNDDTLCLANGLSRAENCSEVLANADRMNAVAVAGYVTAGALAAVTATLWWFSRDVSSREGAAALCVPAFSSAGVVCGASF